MLSDAADAIRGYLDDRPEAYDGERRWVERVLEEMDALRIVMDCPPVVYGDTQSAIRGLRVSLTRHSTMKAVGPLVRAVQQSLVKISVDGLIVVDFRVPEADRGRISASLDDLAQVHGYKFHQ